MSFPTALLSLVLLAGMAGPASGAFLGRAFYVARGYHYHAHVYHRYSTYHAHHLHAALVDLERAKAALSVRNGPVAARYVAAAARQVEAAAASHHTHYLSRTWSGWVGRLLHAAHHHHHSHMRTTIAELLAAERLIVAGNALGAARDINLAEIRIAHAIAFHHHYIGR